MDGMIPVPNTPAPKTAFPSIVRLGAPADEEEILRLMYAAFDEQPIFPLNEAKMRHEIRRAVNRDGGVIGVIPGKDGRLEGYLLAVLSTYWYSDAWHIEELTNFVHPDHRHPGHAKALIEFAKWFAEQMNIPLLMGILSTKRLEAKIRLYKRQVTQAGAVFVYNTGHVNDQLSALG